MTDGTPSASGTPTVLLVHGAFADSSGWDGVVERLQAAGVPVRALVNEDGRCGAGRGGPAGHGDPFLGGWG